MSARIRHFRREIQECVRDGTGGLFDTSKLKLEHVEYLQRTARKHRCSTEIMLNIILAEFFAKLAGNEVAA